MHAVRRSLLEKQAEATGLPLITVSLPWPCANAHYKNALKAALTKARERFAPTHVAFGDLFLEDVRAYRERQMLGTGMEPLFPLWGQPTKALAQEMIAAGLCAILTCVAPQKLPVSFAGCAFDQRLLEVLPLGVDACGENGEFHTFAWNGPMFQAAVECARGETAERDGFVFTDLLLSACAAGRKPSQ